MISFILGAMNALVLFFFENAFMYWKISLVGGKFLYREVNLLLNYDNSAMKIFKLLYVLECQGG